MNRCVYRVCWLALLPLLAPAAWAARDCYFERSDVTITGAYANLKPTSKVSSDTLLTRDAKATYSGVFTSHCQAGDDGQDLWGQTNTGGSGFRWHDSGALFPTNIPGIRYSVHVKPREKPSIADGYLPNYNTFQKIAEISDSADNEAGALDFKDWDIYLDFYQTDEYKGNQGQSKVHPRENAMLGQYRLGGDGHGSEVVSVYVTTMSFGMDITSATCTSAVADVSNSTIEFGDVNINELAAGRVPVKPFSITLSDCSLLNGVTTKLTTMNISADGNMMTNVWVGQQGDATGLGVQIRDANNNTLRPNDPYSVATVNNLTMPGSVKLDFTAELRADGNARKAGQFQATGVFSISYQ